MRRVLAVLLLALAAPALFAQSADQEVVSVVDSPDPVTPGATLTYTITVRNNGPDPAVNGGFNTSLPGELTYIGTTAPAGFTCATFGAAVSCTNPSFAVGTAVFTMTATVGAHLANFPDSSFSTAFSPSGVTPDPNNGNNSKTATTALNSPQVDLSVAVTDSPDPVFPDGNITYTILVTNAGPDPATSVNFNVFNSGTLKFQSATVPAGWNCTLPAVNGTPTFTCTRASFPGGNSTFTVVVRADSAVLGLNDGTVSTVFSANGTGNDTNTGNNVETENTAYVTPDADMGVAVVDSPDPVTPNNNITYTVTVTSSGPDAAPNAKLNVFNNGTLEFQSVTAPAGWTCVAPAVNATPTFQCSNPSFANGGNSVFTVVVFADQTVLGVNDGTLSTVFSVGSDVADPNNANNVETENTAYITPDANLAITATDSPDPVTNGSNLTYAITITNGGPDAGPNTTLGASAHPSLTFQSLAAPAGWSCTTPAVNASGPIQCTNPSFANAGTANFTLVMKLVAAGAGGTLNSVFNTGSGAQDPVTANNSIEVFTNWIGQTTDLSISKSTLTTAVAQGGTITYTLSTINNGPDNATTVTVTDVLPTQLLFQSISTPAGWSCTTPAVGANGTITCTTPLLLNGASANFTLVTTVAPNATGTITNSASVGGGGSDPTPGNSSGSSGAALIAGNADLATTKTTAATSVPPGAAISYTINVTNNGPDPAASVVMTDVLPASLHFQSISAPAGWSCTTPAVGTNGTVTCNAATLANSATATFTLVATAAPNATGTITNTASASHSGTDGNGANSSGSSPATPVDLSATADLAATKTTGATSVAPGQTFAYTITVTNNGPAAATNVVMNDPLPASLLFQSIAAPAGFTCTTPAVNTNGTVNCTAATLANGASATFTLTVRVAAGAIGAIINSIIVGPTQTDPNLGNNNPSSPALPIGPASADLSIAKSTVSTTLVQGSTVSYTITVNNAGPSTAANVTVTDTLPAGLTFVSATPSQGTCSGTTTITCTLGTLASTATATIMLTATVTASSGTITNTATVTSVTSDPNGGNNTGSTPPIPVAPSAAEAGIPTLSEWALIGLAMLLVALAVRRL